MQSQTIYSFFICAVFSFSVKFCRKAKKNFHKQQKNPPPPCGIHREKTDFSNSQNEVPAKHPLDDTQLA